METGVALRTPVPTTAGLYPHLTLPTNKERHTLVEAVQDDTKASNKCGH